MEDSWQRGEAVKCLACSWDFVSESEIWNLYEMTWQGVCPEGSSLDVYSAKGWAEVVGVGWRFERLERQQDETRFVGCSSKSVTNGKQRSFQLLLTQNLLVIAVV